MLPEPKQVLVTVDQAGQTTLNFNGFVGQECLVTSDKLRTALAQLGITLADTNFIAKPALNVGELFEQDNSTSIHQEQGLKQNQG